MSVAADIRNLRRVALQLAHDAEDALASAGAASAVTRDWDEADAGELFEGWAQTLSDLAWTAAYVAGIAEIRPIPYRLSPSGLRAISATA